MRLYIEEGMISHEEGHRCCTHPKHLDMRCFWIGYLPWIATTMRLHNFFSCFISSREMEKRPKMRRFLEGRKKNNKKRKAPQCKLNLPTQTNISHLSFTYCTKPKKSVRRMQFTVRLSDNHFPKNTSWRCIWRSCIESVSNKSKKAILTMCEFDRAIRRYRQFTML